MTVADAILKRDYPDHECPDEMERNGEPRQGWHGGPQHEAGLMLTTSIPPACGCRIVGTGTLQHPLMIEPCAEHREAMYPGVVE